ncbi:hypothetical protein [Lysobacter capsici]|uniref:hypothetical protein n=1 Tax=Lysobacter capsici TaxID=435897 RepID=UPI000B0441F8|nr:hypothetical protein [Lysobacter capsici]
MDAAPPADPFQLDFKVDAIAKIDDLALLAMQTYNLGDYGHWFLCFRQGCKGFHVRLFAVETHYSQLHAWQLRCRWHLEPEYHLASIMFGLDSALECLLYAMNAFGYGAHPAEFVDITTDKGLRSIAPWMILGSSSRAPHPAFEKYYPGVIAIWRHHRDIIEEIQRQHDVSKHRSSTYRGGRSRNDPPVGFYAALGLSDDDPNRFDFAPMAEIILDPDPKRPASAPRANVKYEDLQTLEGLCHDFCTLIEQTCLAWLSDVRHMVTLKHDALLARYTVVGRASVPLFADAECQERITGIQGVRVDWGHAGYPPEIGRIVAACAAIAYREGDVLPIQGEYDYARSIGPAWYRDPDNGQAVQAWSSSAVLVSPPLPPGLKNTHVPPK